MRGRGFCVFLMAVSALFVGRLPPIVLGASGPPPVPLAPAPSTAGPQAPAPSPIAPPPSAASGGATPSPPLAPPVSKASRPAPLSLNGPDALSAYRHSWNPLTSGPDLMPQADTLPEGEFNVRFFMYGRLTQAQYSDSGGITGLPPGFSQTQLLDLFAMFYGLEQNTELVFLPSVVTTFSTEDGSSLNGAGLNDLTLGIKHRWIIQDPDTARPSFATALLVTLPLTSWLGTPVPAGGLPPINVVPSTHFGTPSLTLVSMVRKNVKPLRLIGDRHPIDREGQTRQPCNFQNKAQALLVTLPLTSWLGTPVPAGGAAPHQRGPLDPLRNPLPDPCLHGQKEREASATDR